MIVMFDMQVTKDTFYTITSLETEAAILSDQLNDNLCMLLETCAISMFAFAFFKCIG